MNNTPNHPVSRRETLAKIGIGSAAAAAWLLAPRSSHAQEQMASTAAQLPSSTMAPASDVEIARFALTMEQLQAAFYAQAVAAHQKRAYLSPRAYEAAQTIAAAGADHVRALQGVLTGAGQTLPAATNYGFPSQVFVSPVTFAWFAYTLEEIGIGAYLGAVGNIGSDEIRAAAASIYGAKAQHAAILRSLAGFDFAPRYYEAPLTVEQVTQLIAPYLTA